MSAPKAGERAVPLVRLVRELGSAARFPPINCPHHAGALARHLLADRDRETFLVLHLDAKRRLAAAEVVAVGTLTTTLVHPREVFKGALLANAASVVLAHNHPSGDPAPSPEDLALTRALVAAGALLGVPVDDHLIVGDALVSLRETTDLWS